jgi:hypothetical protein
MKNNSSLRSTRQTAGAALTRRAETVLRRWPPSRAQLKALINEAPQEIVVICRRSTKRQKIGILHLSLPKTVPAGAEWIEAYRRWTRHG